MEKVISSEEDPKLWELIHPDGLRKKVISSPSSASSSKFPLGDDFVEISYIGYIASRDYLEFDRSDANYPMKFQLGSGTVVAGFEKAVMRMSVGERALIFIPSKLAYPTGNGDPDDPLYIKPTDDLVFDLTFISIRSTTGGQSRKDEEIMRLEKIREERAKAAEERKKKEEEKKQRQAEREAKLLSEATNKSKVKPGHKAKKSGNESKSSASKSGN